MSDPNRMRGNCGEPRICPACDVEIVGGEPDPCIGKIAGVSAACCGHGDDSKAYVAFYLSDGSFVAWDGGFTRMSSQELSDAESGARRHGNWSGTRTPNRHYSRIVLRCYEEGGTNDLEA